MSFITNIVKVIINPAIQVILAVAVLYFLWGVWTFVKNSNSPEGREDGARHIGYGLIGIFVMISVFGIMAFIQNAFNLH